MLEKITTMRIG